MVFFSIASRKYEKPQKMDKKMDKLMKENWSQRFISRFLKNIFGVSKKTGE